MPAQRSANKPRGPRLQPLGDAAVYVELGRRIDTALNTRALRLAAALGSRRGVREAVGAYASVTIHYDPDQVTIPGLQKMVAEALAATKGEPLRGRLHRVPVAYGGPDLAEAAHELGLAEEEVVRRHAAPVYRAFMTGFVPGWTYLGPLDPKLKLPRRAVPRTSVPAGSVAIAGLQTGVYPLPSPGGWHLIGTTRMRMFLPDSDPPLLVRPGDRVKFFAV